MLYYITYANIPTKKAFGYAIAKMVSEFGKATEVTLVVPKKKNREISEDIHTYYSLPNNFKVIEVPVVDQLSLLGKKVSFIIQKISFAFSIISLKISSSDIVYSRDILSLFFLKFKTKNIFLEIHYLSRSDKFLVKLIKFARKIIVITSFLKNELVSIGYSKESILISPDAVDLDLFQNIKESKIVLREILHIPKDKKVVVYTGNLYEWKGIYTLVDAFEYLSENIVLVVVGGSPDLLPQFMQYCSSKVYSKRILVVGHKKHTEVPLYLKTADVLVIPNSAKEIISKYNTSPLKLFEYMASGVPIVTSDLPSIREVLSENNATFAVADDSRSFANAISSVLEDKNVSDPKANQALLDVKKYSWRERASNILRFIQVS